MMSLGEYVTSLHNQADDYSIKLNIPAGQIDGVNDSRDAFRHAFASAVMSGDFGSARRLG